jgi:hypothetical protein
MTDNINISSNGKRVFDKFMHALARGSTNITTIAEQNSGRRPARFMRRMWWSAGSPAVDAGSQDTYPVEHGDLAYDSTNDACYVCTTAPEATTDAVFTQIH